MNLLESDWIKLHIIRQLARESPASVNAITTALGANPSSVKRSCEFLEFVKLIEFEDQVEGGKVVRRAKLTPAGEDVAGRLPRNLPKGKKRRKRPA